MNVKLEKNKIPLMIFGIVFLFMGCTGVRVSSKVRQYFTLRLETEVPLPSKKIRTDGYYSVKISPDRHCGSVDLIYPTFNCIFYEDGTYAASFYFKQNLEQAEITKNLSQAIYSNIYRAAKGAWAPIWGVYKIVGDTLVVQSLVYRGRNLSCQIREDHYRILHPDSIMNIALFLPSKNACNWFSSLTYSIAVFHPADSIPPPDTWLKDFPWIWKNPAKVNDYYERKRTVSKK